MRLMRLISLVVFGIVGIGECALAEIKATTEDGRDVVLSDDGTWRFDVPQKNAENTTQFYEDAGVKVQLASCSAEDKAKFTLSITNKSRQKLLKTALFFLSTNQTTGETTWLPKLEIKATDYFGNDLGFPIFHDHDQAIQPGATFEIGMTSWHAPVVSSGGATLSLPANSVGNISELKVGCSFTQK